VTKTDALRTALTAAAKELGQGARFPTVRAICREYGVSLVTVDRVLCEMQAEGLVSRQQGRGVFVASVPALQRIGLVFGSNVFDGATSPIYSILLEQCRLHARNGSKAFRYYIDQPEATADGRTMPVHRDLEEDVRLGRLQGLLFTNLGLPAQQQWRRSLGVPAVSFLPTIRAPRTVGIDYVALVKAGVRELAAQGCRRIALLTVFGFARAAGFDGHRVAFRNALCAAGLPLREAWMWDAPVPPGDDVSEKTARRWEEDGRLAVQDLFGMRRSNAPRPDGLVIVDDMMARGALSTLASMGVRVGQDVHVATHASRGSHVLHDFAPAITQLEIDPTRIVEAMFAMLEDLMSGAETDPPPVLIQPTLARPEK
jgi:DNA-binding LacI/PurR family transcriptional regulator